ncbi:MAG: hypothetical protein ACYSUD_21705 [Planctomycetota bacterium]|jgi:hypothetical protein
MQLMFLVNNQTLVEVATPGRVPGLFCMSKPTWPKAGNSSSHRNREHQLQLFSIRYAQNAGINDLSCTGGDRRTSIVPAGTGLQSLFQGPQAR